MFCGVFGSHSLVLLEAAVGSVGCMDKGGVCFCVFVCSVWPILADCDNEVAEKTDKVVFFLG